jgi:class 3 adenylate cyclase
MHWEIEIQNLNSLTGKNYVFKKTMLLIGRSVENDLVIQNTTVSRYHLQLTYKKNKCFAEDLKSANGTYIYKENKWTQFQGCIIEEPPVMLRLGKDIAITARCEDYNASDNQTNLLRLDNSQPYLSGIYCINSLMREQTIMVLDLCESTKISEQDEIMALHLKTRLESISKFALSSSKVHCIKNTGDGFIVTFSCAIEALRTSRLILNNIKVRNNKTKNPAIHVRIGLHKGVVYMTDSADQDIHGKDVNVTFRIESLQEESFSKIISHFPDCDRILCSSSFYEALSENSNNDDIKAHFCGQACLKGFESQFDIYWIE